MAVTPLNLCTYKWDLNEDACACDVQFNEWLRQRALTGKSIYHFGTGSHHAVGIEQSTNGSGNAVMGITASTEEFGSYLQVISKRADISRNYLVYFGDIYLTNAKLIPEVDIVTLFHICEFSDWYTKSSQYGGLDDAALLDLFTRKVKTGGYVLFYAGSMAADRTADLIADWERDGLVEKEPPFKQLMVYRKTGLS